MGHFGGHFGGHLGARSAQEGAKMGPRELLRASKTHKSAFAKTLKNLQFFRVFWGPRLPKTASKSPRRLPRGTQRVPKPEKNRIQKWTPKLLFVGLNLGPFWGPFWGQNGLQNWSKTGSIFGLVFGPVFTDFENPGGRPAVARRRMLM